MRHELGHARWQSSKMREGASERPVRAGSGLAEEVIGSPQARRQGPGARGLVLAPDGHAEAPRGVEHDFGDGREQTDVMVRVEMSRLAAHQHGELLELGAHLALDVPRVGAGRGMARVADEAAVDVHERARPGERSPQGEVHVDADTEAGVAQRRQLLRVDRRGGEQCGAADDAVAAGREDPGAHPRRETEIIGVDDQSSRHSRISRYCPISRYFPRTRRK